MILSIFAYTSAYSLSLFFLNRYQKVWFKKRWSKKAIYPYGLALLAVLPAALLAGFRANGVGIDTITYRDIFHYVRENNNLTAMFQFYIDKGYYFLNMTAAFLFGESWGLFFLISLINLIFVFKSLLFYKKELSMAFGMFIFFMCYFQPSFNAIRQFIAVCIILYAYQYVIQEDFKRYVFWILAAATFHKTAVLCLIFWVIKRNNRINGEIKKFSVLVYYIFIFSSPLWGYLAVKLIVFFSKTFHLYESYSFIIYDFDLGFLLYILPPLFLILLFRKNIVRKNPKYVFYIRLAFLQIPFQFLGCFIPYVDRLSLYAGIVQVILVPLTIAAIQDKKTRRIIKGCFTLWYLFYYVVMFLLLNANNTYPYYSIFNK